MDFLELLAYKGYIVSVLMLGKRTDTHNVSKKFLNYTFIWKGYDFVH